MKKSKNEVVWHCVTCDKSMGHKEFLDHAKTFHNIDTSKGGTQRMTAHMDGTDWFSSTYDVEVGGFKFIQTVRCERAQDDMMRYM